MKIYPIVDLTGDSYLNPNQAYGDGSGTHQRKVETIKSISIHHDASQRPHVYDSVARYRSEAAAHYTRLGPGLQYHFKIDNQGTIFKIRPLTTWLYAVGSAENVSMIAICLDGYFHPPYNEKPTREQYEALGQLLINLCEQHPEFPATYPDVRPHRDYSSTACPGDGLAPWVLAINSKANVLNIPTDAVYDWPEDQPSTPKPPVTPVDTRPEWEKNFVAVDKQLWSEGTATIVDLSNNTTIGTVEDNKQLDIGGLTTVGGTDFYITKYWTSRKVYNKAIPAAQLKATPDPVVIPPVPVTPPDNTAHDIADLQKRVGVLEGLVKTLWDYLSRYKLFAKFTKK
jgi:hypothetical protein